MEKLSCGIDIHKEKLAGCIMDETGKTRKEHIFPLLFKDISLHCILRNVSSTTTIIAPCPQMLKALPMPPIAQILQVSELSP